MDNMKGTYNKLDNMIKEHELKYNEYPIYLDIREVSVLVKEFNPKICAIPMYNGIYLIDSCFIKFIQSCTKEEINEAINYTGINLYDFIKEQD